MSFSIIKPRHELHVHLYGCLTAEELFESARHLPRDSQRVEFYKKEFLRITGRQSQFDRFWTEENGFQFLKDEYMVTDHCAFPRFQAAINLPIALFPPASASTLILKRAMERHFSEGLEYVEYRVFLPPYFSAKMRGEYLTEMAEHCHRFRQDTKGKFDPRMAISIVRDAPLCDELYRNVKDWQNSFFELRENIVAIDFCGSEVGHAPESKRGFIARLHADNASDPKSALALLYHVGEMWDHLSPEEAISWVEQVAVMNVHRIGHATIVGVNPHELEHSDPKKIELLQTRVMNLLREKNMIVETCPASNRWLAQIKNETSHPSLRFLKNDLRVTIGADDPGIFGITLADEFEWCARHGVNKEKLQKIADDIDSRSCNLRTSLLSC